MLKELFTIRIRICSKCKTSREHIYCRKSYGAVSSEVWLCEKCEFGTTVSPKSEQKAIRESLIPEGVDASAENRELVIVLPEENKIQGPARDSCWNGNFRVGSTGTLEDLRVAIEAHTPDLVRWKLLKFSKKLPQVLFFKLLPRPQVWTGIFQDYCPGKADIGLYLFSGSSNRSENYVRLVEFMEASDVVLRSCVNGVDLLVFPSKCLTTDAQKWRGEHFLWGLFRRVKKKGAQQKSRDKLPPPGPPSGLVNQNGESNMEDTSGDMDVVDNMIVGIEVGIPKDIPIPRAVPQMQPHPISRNFTFLDQPVVKEVRIPDIPILPRVPSLGTQGSVPIMLPPISRSFTFLGQPPAVRQQLVKDIPPGFEESDMNVAASSPQP